MDPDADLLFAPTMNTTEMLNTFDTDMEGSMQETDNFFSSALAADYPERLFPEDGLNSPPFQPSQTEKMHATQDSANSFHNQIHTSISPDSSLQDSSSDSSGHRKRRSSSKSSRSGFLAGDSPISNAIPSNDWNNTQKHIKREFTINDVAGSTPNFDNMDFNNRVSGELFDFDSAGNSPSQEITLNSTPYCGRRHVAIPYEDSPPSSTSLNNGNTRETSPMSNSAKSEIKTNPSQPSRPSPLATHEEYLDSSLLKGMEQRSWPFGEDTSNVLVPQLRMATPTNVNNLRPRFETGAAYPALAGGKPALWVDPTPQKSRVETQIPIRMTMFPLPNGVDKLHLPPHTISKPKLLAKPPPTLSPDTLELHTMLVCSSAMLDPIKRRRALFKAEGLSIPSNEEKRRLSTGERTDRDDEELPLNGGEVRICGGCITRERKRAARKKSKKPEEEEPWQREEARRVVVFNTSEIKEWQPLQSHGSLDSQQEGAKGQGNNFPEGAMQVEIPMRIACYCRHQNEKLGFQVILTIKNHLGGLVSQAITNSIMITDDHKTHPTPGQMQPQAPYFGDHTQMMASPLYTQEPLNSFTPALYRNAHSTTDLQSLQQSFNPQFLAQTMTPYAIPHESSQTTSTSMTPRNLSRQASPSPNGGPLPKKRKASGGVGRVPNNLTMTRLQTDSSVQDQQWTIPASASSTVASPFTPVFPPGSGPQSQNYVQHVHQRSGHFNMGSQTTNSNDWGGLLSQANRSQSFENFTSVPQMYSAPPSTLPSRASSPSGGLQMANPINTDFGVGPASAVYPAASLSQQRVPIIHKLIPSEGPKAGGIEVTCLGSGFSQGLEVMFGESLATTTTYWGENSLVCLLPPALRAGTVPVMFKHQFQQKQQQAQLGRFPSPPLSKPQTLFKYVDDDEQELVRQALLIVSQKMRGDVNDAGQVARWIVNGPNTESQGSWLGNQQGSGYQRQASDSQSYLASAVDCERAVLKCLELIDLDESSYPARLNLRRQNGQTILHLAAALGYHRVVAGLLARGANPDSRDRNGMSPMHMAALNGHAQIVRRLRVSGGDSTMRSLSGFTPADMASSRTVLDAVESLNLLRSRSAGPRPLLIHSRTNSSYLASSTPLTPVDTIPLSDATSSEGNIDDSNASDADSDLELAPSRQWVQSRRNSNTIVPALASPELDNNHGYMFAVAAMAAWRDQIAAQLQQLQQSVNFTRPNLPPIPSLADYQAYPMMRRFSSFVPHRNSRPSSSNGAEPDSKESDPRWWEFLTGGSSPPAYEEIYPPDAQKNMEVKTASAAQAAADAAADQKCSAIYDVTPSTSSRPRESKMSAKEEEELSLIQRKNVKRLRSDRKLFCIWIPLLVLVMAAMLKDRVPELWHAGRSIVSAVSERYRQPEAVAY